ncbi:DNA-binding Lrp family transcriptional regulator [Roseateles depolymerans]|uniref:AsnC family transcriptional regulator n=1 Tax=Roseateles depolymerans TaxID=76731 RepID=A0A0U3MKZ0_9BURK|nr:AsnC family transcriptional regulator [Roseateles depolymerans]REG15018.1 DNA-binding Lrp family transcriptional regulator [Roseateles depolymerans]
MASRNQRQGKTLTGSDPSTTGGGTGSATGAAAASGGAAGAKAGGLAGGLAGGAASADADEAGGTTASGLDRYHVAILAALQKEARLSNAELASRIGLSAAPTWRRVRWLEEQGFITGYRAEIDRRKLGLGVLAFVRVDADRNNGAATRELEQAIRALPEVIACHYISGAGTFELQVMATDLDAFSRFSIDTLLNLPNVKDIHTSFSLGEVKAGGALPLGHLKP